VALDVDSHDQKLTRHQYVLEVTSSLICPLAPSVVQRPLPGSELDISDYPTWRVPSTQLQSVLRFLWDSLEPESEKILGNESLIVEDVPDFLIPRQKLSGKDKVPYLLCGQKHFEGYAETCGRAHTL